MDFLVWKLGPLNNKKGYAVVDITKLNKLVVSDSYVLTLQANIITSVQGYTNLAIFDTVFFFY